MAIKFETFDKANAICEQGGEVSEEQEEKISKRAAKINAVLRKKMEKIARVESEAWKKTYYKRKNKH